MNRKTVLHFSRVGAAVQKDNLNFQTSLCSFFHSNITIDQWWNLNGVQLSPICLTILTQCEGTAVQHAIVMC